MKAYFGGVLSVGFLLLIGITSCDEDSLTQAQRFSVIVQVLYPLEHFGSAVAVGAEVKLLDMANDTIKSEVTDQEGKAELSDLVPGTYTIYASKRLSREEAQVLAGIGWVINLGAILEDVVVGPRSKSEIEIRLSYSLQTQKSDGLVISEVYYAGCSNVPSGNYSADQFIELDNSSSLDYSSSVDTVYLDSLCIADIYGASGQIDESSQPTPFNTDPDHVYANNVWMIPGNGKDFPIAPFRRIVIAQDAINHRLDPNGHLNPMSDANLENADWEIFVPGGGDGDSDSPTVPNLVPLYFTGESDWVLQVSGPALVIFKTDNFDALERVSVPEQEGPPKVKIPSDLVIDAVEALKDANSIAYKRIPFDLDAGFTYVFGTYTGESVIRWGDTNNSSRDFRVRKPPSP